MLSLLSQCGDYLLGLELGVLKQTTASFVFGTGPTGFEPATSAVTGRCSNQLNYGPSSCEIRSFGT